MLVGIYGWKLVLDSDMLFSLLSNEIEWLKNPTRPIHIMDIQNYYGYSKDLMESVSKKRIPDRLNVGVIGIQ